MHRLGQAFHRRHGIFPQGAQGNVRGLRGRGAQKGSLVLAAAIDVAGVSVLRAKLESATDGFPVAAIGRNGGSSRSRCSSSRSIVERRELCLQRRKGHVMLLLLSSALSDTRLLLHSSLLLFCFCGDAATRFQWLSLLEFSLLNFAVWGRNMLEPHFSDGEILPSEK